MEQITDDPQPQPMNGRISYPSPADSMKHIGHVALMVWLVSRWGPLFGRGLFRTGAKACLSAGVMALILWGGYGWMAPLLPPVNLLNELILVGGLSMVGGVVYLLGVWVLRVEEMGEVVRMLGGKIKSNN